MNYGTSVVWLLTALVKLSLYGSGSVSIIGLAGAKLSHD